MFRMQTMSDEKDVECNSCGGTGGTETDDGDWYDCDECDGTGFVTIRTYLGVSLDEDYEDKV
jgi:DnaJ-class molecular chaperone